MAKKTALKICTTLFILITASMLLFMLNPFLLKADTSQNSDIILKKIYSEKFPDIIFYIDFKEGSQLGSIDLTAEDLNIVENGQQIKNVVVEKADTVNEPIGVVLVLDTSGSMKGEPIEAAKSATALFIDEMRKIDKFAIVGFSDNIRVYSSFTRDRQQLYSSIAQIEAKGETSLFDGIDISIEQFANINLKYKYIVVLSDGMDTVSKLKYTDNISKAQRENITIYSIALISKDYNPANLKEISESTNGELLTAASAGQLKELYEKISRKIRNQYKISYTSQWPNIEKIQSDIFIEKSGIRDSITISYANPYFAPQPTASIIQEPSSFLKFFDIWWVRIIIYAVIFICVIMFLFALILIIIRPKPVLKKKTEIYSSKTSVQSAEVEAEEEEEGATRPGTFFRRRKATAHKPGSRRGLIESLELKLERAGLKIRSAEFLTIQIASIILIGILFQFFFKNVLLTGAIVIIIIVMPILFVNLLVARRIQRFDEQLPDTLQLISGALKAGYSFNQSINMVIDETKPPVSDEFSRILNEVRMGLPENEALENSSGRVGSSHFKWVVMAINVQREVGGNLSEIMDIIADTIRERARVTSQIRALTAEGRLSAIILIALPIILGIILFAINRAYISLLFTNRLGLALIVFSAVLMIVGIIWIVKIVNVKY